MSSTAGAEQSQSDYTCRICLEDGERADFIAPCACAGSQRWVHRECLDKWRSMREDKAFSRCTECLKPYKMVSRSEDNNEMTHSRRCRFVSLVLRDFSIVLVISQLCIVVLGLIVFGFDAHSHALINALHQASRPVLFYYLAGLFFTLSLLGMGFSAVQIGCCGDRNGSCSNCHNNRCAGSDCICIDVYYPFMYTGPHGGATLECCACCPHAECCGACQCCSESAGTAGGAGCTECAAGASVGEECAMCMVVVAVIFALVGVFVCVVVGAAYAQSVVRTHYHVLQKYTLASDFIVADLAEGALPLSSSDGSDRGGKKNDGDVEGEVGSGVQNSSSWWGNRAAVSAGREGYTRAPTSEYGGMRNQEGERVGGEWSDADVGAHVDIEAGGASGRRGIELLPLSLPQPSAPPPVTVPTTTAHSSIIMDRSSSGNALNHYPDASAPLIHSHGAANSSSSGDGSPSLLPSAPPLPYDPATHRFSRTQYQELLSRGLM